MESKAYIIADNKIVAEVRTSLRNGETVRFAFGKVREEINAARDWNLANSWPGKISRAKKWDAAFAKSRMCWGYEINPEEFYIGIRE